MTSSPNLHGNRYASLMSTDDDDCSDGACNDDDDPLALVMRRKKRMRQRESTSPATQMPHQQVNQSTNQINRDTRQATQTRQQQRAPAMFGRAVNRDAKVAAARTKAYGE